jgi:hypothetical protein
MVTKAGEHRAWEQMEHPHRSCLVRELSRPLAVAVVADKMVAEVAQQTVLLVALVVVEE